MIPRDEFTPPIVIEHGDIFLATLRPPEWLIDGLVPRGRLYSFTAPTGHGKTAVAAAMQLCLSSGAAFAGREVERGRVLVLAGENPEDYALRLLATCQAMKLHTVHTHDIGVVAGSFGIGGGLGDLESACKAFGGEWAAVFVDTSAAFFDGDDENANTAMRMHASHLRTLTELPGRPAVIVLCHPTKGATRENLLPRGGGAFLAEVDGNLTAWREGTIVTVHWAGKLRGPGFEPITFELQPQTLGIRDSKGRDVVSVAAVPTTIERMEEVAARELDAENRLLVALLRNPRASIEKLAMAAGFTSEMGSPQKSRTFRMLHGLSERKLACKGRDGKWKLTPAGKSEAQEATE